MGRRLEARIKRAAKKVAKREHQLAVANEKYRELLDEAREKGVKSPRTILTNPLMPPRVKTDGL